MDAETEHAETILIEIRGYASDGCSYVREVTVLEPESLTPEWWADVVFPLTGDGRHRRTVTMEVATVVQSSSPDFVGSRWERQG